MNLPPLWRALRLLLPVALVCAGSLLTTAPVQAASHEVHRFYGYAFDEASGKYLYTEVHNHQYDGDRWLSGTVRYYGPDNRLIGEKTLDFAQDPYIPLFRLKLPQQKYEEAVTAISATGVDMERLSEGRLEKGHLDRVPGLVADAGFHSFIVDHLDELRAGKTVPFPFAVAGRLTSYRFRLSRTGEAQQDGHPVLRLKGEADSLLRLVAPALSLTYDLTTHYLVEYHGVSNMHDPATGKAWPAVRIVFPARPPAGAPSPLPSFEG
jgi:hypothetical protein